MSTEKSGISGRVDARLYDNEDLVGAYPDWHEMTDSEKIDAAREIDPVAKRHESNVTTNAMHAYFVRNLSGNRTGGADNVYAEWIALGNNANAGTSPSDEDLNERIASSRVSDWGENESEAELRCSAIVGGEVLNEGDVINELGLFSGNPSNIHRDEVFILNHASFDELEAGGDSSLTFDVTLQFTNV